MLVANLQDLVPVDHTAAFPNTSFPVTGPSAEFFAENNYAEVSLYKPYDSATEKLVSVAPYYEAPYVYVVAVEPKTQEELDADTAAAFVDLQNQSTQATQARLDAFAQTRNYDGILSLCTYADSTVQKFAEEGLYGIQARDATWAKLYEILAEVQDGTRPMPSGYNEIEAELPALVWPV